MHQAIFDRLYRASLLYNACWEDPACDRVALDLGPTSRVLVITSGGCNALDYALEAPQSVVAVDANPRQGALLELKIAGIRSLDHADFFALFGAGRHPDFPGLYRRHLRPQLSPAARTIWDGQQRWFSGSGWRDSFYFHGLSGLVARLVRSYLRLRPRLAGAVSDLLACRTLAEQTACYDADVAPRLWTRHLAFLISRQTTMSLLGVPPAQTAEVARAGGDQDRAAWTGVAGFIRRAIDRVFRDLPLSENYFWRVYLTGSYGERCCPRYLTPQGFSALRAGLADRISVVTSTITDHLASLPSSQGYDRFVLLDHMDWMAREAPVALAEEWGHLIDRAAPGSRYLFRTAHPHAGYLDAIRVAPPGAQRGALPLRSLLSFDTALADQLHVRDRVGTYGGVHLATLEHV